MKTSDTLTAKGAAELGTSKTQLSRGARSGRFERVARGIYRLSDAEPADLDMVEAAARRPDGTICLISALVHHGLVDDIPAALDVAIPRGARIPATAAAIRWHLFDKDTFAVGREELTVPGTGGLRIGMYSPERSIADAYRLRGAIGYETANQALRTWLNRGGKSAELIEIALRLPRAKTPLLQALTTLA